MTWVPWFVSLVLMFSMFTILYQMKVMHGMRSEIRKTHDAFMYADMVACAVLTRTPCDGCGHVLREGQHATVRVTPTGVIVAHPLCVPPWGNPEN